MAWALNSIFLECSVFTLFLDRQNKIQQMLRIVRIKTVMILPVIIVYKISLFHFVKDKILSRTLFVNGPHLGIHFLNPDTSHLQWKFVICWI
jgi:hypothetical protein